MKHLKLFEEFDLGREEIIDFFEDTELVKVKDSILQTLAEDFLNETSLKWDLRLSEPFDRELANCSWFSKEFFTWAQDRGYDCKLVYFDHPEEAHISPLIADKTIDFTVKQFTKNPEDDYLILKPQDYKKWGYPTFEIFSELPDFLTIREPNKIKTSLY